MKLMKCGGITEALNIIQEAKRHKLKTMIGCMGESSVSIAAAASISGVIDHIDLDSYNLNPDPSSGVKMINGVTIPNLVPGHGAVLKPLYVKNQKVAIYMQGFLHSDFGKMGLGIIRYLENPIVGVIDTENAGSNINIEYEIDRDIPIFSSLEEVLKKGAEVLVLGIAPSGGKIPKDWLPIIKDAINKGISIINGLHDTLGDRFNKKIKNRENQWIWDVRVPSSCSVQQKHQN